MMLCCLSEITCGLVRGVVGGAETHRHRVLLDAVVEDGEHFARPVRLGHPRVVHGVVGGVVLGAEGPVAQIDAVHIGLDVDLGAGRPVSRRAIMRVLVVGPIPGAGLRRCRRHVQSLLHLGLVHDRCGELEDHWLADADTGVGDDFGCRDDVRVRGGAGCQRRDGEGLFDRGAVGG